VALRAFAAERRAAARLLLTAGRAAIDRYLLAAGPTAANPQQQRRAADLHVAQLMPLPLTVSCFSKVQIGFAFLVPAHPGSPGKRAVKRVCVRVCVCLVPRAACRAHGGRVRACKVVSARMRADQLRCTE